MRTASFQVLPFMLALLMPAALNAQCDTTLQQRNCLVTLTNGRSVQVDRFWSIGSSTLEYVSDGSLHDLSFDRIRLIRCDARTFVIRDGLLCPLNPPRTPTTSASSLQGKARVQPDTTLKAKVQEPDSMASTASFQPFAPDTTRAIRQVKTAPTKMYLQGGDDARASFEPWDAAVAGFLLTPTLMGSPVVASVPPSKNRLKRHYDQQYASDPEYRKGFDAVAKRRKSQWAGIGFLVGILTIVALASAP